MIGYSCNLEVGNRDVGVFVIFIDIVDDRYQTNQQFVQLNASKYISIICNISYKLTYVSHFILIFV